MQGFQAQGFGGGATPGGFGTNTASAFGGAQQPSMFGGGTSTYTYIHTIVANVARALVKDTTRYHFNRDVLRSLVYLVLSR
jgi:hypothetical protein